ncbi:MAG: hypothetical protein K5765_07390 [Clostridia bacterium]|nr:hypothetical protein [Clostridia bacterium]
MSNENLKCPICGEPTRVYMGNARKDLLCGKHADELKKGNIVVNAAGYFTDAKTKEILNSDYKKKVEESKQKFEKKEKEDGGVDYQVKCISCGKETKPGFFFCGACYKKYKDKRLLVEIKNCRDITLLDDSYEGMYTCKDGHIVKSKSERDIDNYLFEHGIPHAYEKAIAIDSDESHDIHPDFFLPNFNGKGDVYIEHWGFNENNLTYTKSKNYKMKIYKEKGLTIISTTEKDIQDIETSLKRKLDFFKEGQINE